MGWTLKRDVVNPETGLAKIAANRLDEATGASWSCTVKGRTQTDAEKQAMWELIWEEYQDAVAGQAVDSVCAEGVVALNNMEAE